MVKETLIKSLKRHQKMNWNISQTLSYKSSMLKKSIDEKKRINRTYCIVHGVSLVKKWVEISGNTGCPVNIGTLSDQKISR